VRGLQGAPALVRIARREVRRHPRRSALIVVLIAVPVAVVACGLATQASLEPTEAELRSQELGRADIVVGIPDPDRELRRQGTGSPEADRPATERTLREVLPEDSEVVPDRRTRLDVSAADLATGALVIATDAPHAINDGRFRVSDGRLPLRRGEAQCRRAWRAIWTSPWAMRSGCSQAGPAWRSSGSRRPPARCSTRP
jgi:putative ABC transport system permease protein